MSAKEFEKRVTASGAKVTKISKAQAAKAEKKYKSEREKASKALDRAWYSAAPKPRKGMKGH
jgi:hypothetical protein